MKNFITLVKTMLGMFPKIIHQMVVVGVSVVGRMATVEYIFNRKDLWFEKSNLSI